MNDIMPDPPQPQKYGSKPDIVTAEWWPDDPGAPMYIQTKPVQPGGVAKSVPVETEIVCDYNTDGELTGIEILGIKRKNDNL